MNAHQFIEALSIIMAVAAATTVLFHRLRQPVVLGYILAGLIVGPHLPIPLVANEQVVRLLSELGVILLMFSLGLEFSVGRLMRVGSTAGVTAVIQCGLMAWLGFLLGQAFGWSALESIFMAAALAVSSTTIIAKAFEELKVTGPLKELVVGVLVVEDLISVVAMAALTALAAGEGLSSTTLLQAGGKLLGFLVGALLLGLLLVPRAMRYIVSLGVSETTLVASLGVCFVGSLLAMKSGYSVALGAFIAGSLVAESKREHSIELLVRPVRDMFAAVFFVSVGMLLDPKLAWAHWPEVLAFTALVVTGKLLSVGAGALLSGAGMRTATRAGMSMAQIGEFSFIIIGLGLSLGVVRPFLYPVVVTISVLTTLLTPMLIRHSGRAAEWTDRKLPKTLLTFTTLYTGWLDRLRHDPDRSALKVQVLALGKLLFLDTALVFIVVLATASYSELVAIRIEGWTGLGPGSARALVGALSLVAALPFLLGAARVSRSLGQLLAGSAFPPPGPGNDAPDLGLAPRKAMVSAVQLLSLLIPGLPFLAFAQPLLQGWAGGIVLALVLTLLAWNFWRHAQDLQGHVRAGTELLAEAMRTHLGNGLGTHPEPLRELGAQGLSGLDAGMGHPQMVRITEQSPVQGRTLSEIRLRGRTGATVLTALRADGSPVEPCACTVLLAGDVLALAGSPTAIQEARNLLQGESPPEAPPATLK